MLRESNRFVVALVVAAPMLLLVREISAAEPPTAKTWSGTWMNRKYKTSGPLKCVAVRQDDGTVAATFSGKFVNDPFSYDVTIDTKSEKDRTVLVGKATLDGDKYEWSGYVRGKNLTGQFKSLKGHNGEFKLEETTKK
jgi:hypothetical protein